jgi:cell division protein FtsA
MPVRVGTPNDIYGIADVLRDPAYATVVGLLLWGTKHDGKSQWKSGMFGGLTQMVTQFKKLFSKPS